MQVKGPENSIRAAARYVGDGYCVVPVPSGEKNPGRPGWQSLRISEEEVPSYFNNGQNIGVHTGEPSGWLVDVDLDTPEAREIAGRFLPETLTSGRPSSPDSHWWYYAEGAEYRTFSDLAPNGEVLLELRSNGHHTLVYPSVHPSGEKITWSESGLETHSMDAGKLAEACRKLAAASLIARHLPELKDKRTNAGGGRHNLALALAGFLLRRGLSEEAVLAILLAGWDARGFDGDQIAQREAHRDLEGLVRDTARRVRDGEDATGGRRLEELVPGLPRKLADFFGWKGPLQDEAAETYMRTDLGNAKRFVDAYSADVRWCTEANRWMFWDGTRWCWDEGSHATHRLAHKSVRSIFEEAKNAADNQEAKAISAHAVASQAASRIEALLSQAKAYMNISVDDLDRDVWLVNARNGTLDLRTGELGDHDREDLITKCVPFDYDPEASVPRFEKFLRQVLPDPEVRAFVQRYAGYSLTGSTAERVLAFLHGGGKNGKSTLVEALREAAGEYAQNTTVETILSSRGGSQIPNDVAALKGARLVSAAEPEKNRRMAESKVKNLTGSDTVTARFMRGEFFDFKPEFKLWISMNHKPIIVGTDDAIWDRIRLVPFNQRFADNPDTGLPAKLAEERAGIFAWMVRGALDWYENGLGCPEAVAAATKEYREEMDTLGDFLEARCVVEPNATAPAAALYKQYELWCADAGEHPDTQRAFGLRLSERGFESFKFTSGPNKDRKGWRGVGIRADDSDPESGPSSSQSTGNRADAGFKTPLKADRADDRPLSESYGFAGETSGLADKEDDSGQESGIKSLNYLHEAVMPKTYPQSSASSAPAYSNATQEDVALSPEGLKNRCEDGEASPLAQLFAKPPEWLKNQTAIYRRNPTERMLNPLCAAIAHEIGANPEQIRSEVERELERLE
ncbi:phage/plasmid primase, P4 family [Rubrobacter aplysinae]|uniref:phage/plasmid primase, P4 family n=1 Tax=Rubrobacter aplysinae TaxID=909625 RepID=UPI00069D893C|nr:phage/plasmid primase, P4 family [Rubrobacter aplysinae]